MGTLPAVRVFISYAQDDFAHIGLVRRFRDFLRDHGVDPRFDEQAAERPRDWPIWMQRQIERSAFILVIASPAYKLRADGNAAPDLGRGVRWESRLIREFVYADADRGLAKVLPVVLPGRSAAEIPAWLGPTTHTRYELADFSAEAAAPLLRYLTGRPHQGATQPGPASAGAALSTPAPSTATPAHQSAAPRYRIGGDFVAGDKSGGDNIIGGGKHVHVYQPDGSGEGNR